MSLFDDTYYSIAAPSEGLFRDKGSKFLAYAYPFTDEGQLKVIIANLKTQHPKARHYCWAYRITPDRSVFRLNDDGEPSGTAGRPILHMLLSKDLTNILVVVVRYFGGTLLGVPGLINAYKTATKLALEESEVIPCTVNDVYAISFDYQQMNEVMRLVKEENLAILKQDFDNRCVMEVEVRKLQVNQFVNRMEKLTSIAYSFITTK
ncbi:IMPACT family protein [Sphingobacterium griseoflavum]|uniref:Impact N-terminal domain-containing protein n=1 Tax=Sphingobacterium griseoflavum TaxID=1474952 RepID=A0ABQ3HWT2_9SPHI|nr:YigZ family protein [Sphingobacterium griseoflavum]GHE30816.1 hypothetical protein GCM10017764_12250 [Sphingobacterium griseoflavum]